MICDKKFRKMLVNFDELKSPGQREVRVGGHKHLFSQVFKKKKVYLSLKKVVYPVQKF